MSDTSGLLDLSDMPDLPDVSNTQAADRLEHEFHESLFLYVDRLVGLTARHRFRELFGDGETNWWELGKKHGFNRQGRAMTLDAICKIYDAAFQAGRLVHAQAQKGHDEWETTRGDRRREELDLLEKEAKRLAATVDEADPDSEISRASSRRNLYEAQYETAVALSRIASGEDTRTVMVTEEQNERVAFAHRMDRRRREHQAAMADSYAERTSALLLELARLREQLHTVPQDDPDYEAKVAALDAEIRMKQETLRDLPEQRVIEGMAKLTAVEAPVVPAGTNEMQTPSWWRIRLPAYRRLLWIGLIVAICGDQLVMQQLTGGFLGVRTLPILLADMTAHIEEISLITTWPEQLSVAVRLAVDVVWMVLALAFGFMPLLLSLPLRKLLDRDSDGTRRRFDMAFWSVVGLFIGAFLCAAMFDALGGQTTTGGTAQAISQLPMVQVLKVFFRGLALASIVGVLIMGAAVTAHLLFGERARANFHAFLIDAEIDRLRRESDSAGERVAIIRNRAFRARADVNGAVRRHANEDALIKAMKFDIETLKAGAEQARRAAAAAYESGYATGISIRHQGIEIKAGMSDSRSLNDVIAHLTKMKAMDLLGELNGTFHLHTSHDVEDSADAQSVSKSPGDRAGRGDPASGRERFV